jgi:transcriptional regulator with XRE-family HTH domain
LVAERLRAWRLASKLPLKQVAGDFGVSEATWARWEKGSRFPSPAYISRLAEYMKVPVCDLFFTDDQPCQQRGDPK